MNPEPYSELQFKVSLARAELFMNELRRLGFDVGHDADYQDPTNFMTVIVRDVPAGRRRLLVDTANRYATLLKHNNPGNPGQQFKFSIEWWDIPLHGMIGTIRTVPENYYVASIKLDKSLDYQELEAMTRNIDQNMVRQWFQGQIQRKWAPSQVWAACKQAGVPVDERDVIVKHYQETGELPFQTWPSLKLIESWPEQPQLSLGIHTHYRWEWLHIGQGHYVILPNDEAAIKLAEIEAIKDKVVIILRRWKPLKDKKWAILPPGFEGWDLNQVIDHYVKSGYDREPIQQASAGAEIIYASSAVSSAGSAFLPFLPGPDEKQLNPGTGTKTEIAHEQREEAGGVFDLYIYADRTWKMVGPSGTAEGKYDAEGDSYEAKHQHPFIRDWINEQGEILFGKVPSWQIDTALERKAQQNWDGLGYKERRDYLMDYVEQHIPGSQGYAGTTWPGLPNNIKDFIRHAYARTGGEQLYAVDVQTTQVSDLIYFVLAKGPQEALGKAKDGDYVHIEDRTTFRELPKSAYKWGAVRLASEQEKKQHL